MSEELRNLFVRDQTNEQMLKYARGMVDYYTALIDFGMPDDLAGDMVIAYQYCLFNQTAN